MKNNTGNNQSNNQSKNSQKAGRKHLARKPRHRNHAVLVKRTAINQSFANQTVQTKTHFQKKPQLPLMNKSTGSQMFGLSGIKSLSVKKLWKSKGGNKSESQQVNSEEMKSITPTAIEKTVDQTAVKITGELALPGKSRILLLKTVFNSKKQPESVQTNLFDQVWQTNQAPHSNDQSLLARWSKNPQVSGAVAAVLLFVMLVAAIIPTTQNVRAEESETAAQNPTMQLAKEYIYAGSRMLAIEEYGLSGNNPNPTPTPPVGSRTNVALASNGSSISVTSTYAPSTPASSMIDGLRHSNNQYMNNGTWVSAVNPASQPQLVEVQFPSLKTIDEINVFTLADAIQYNTDPSLTDTFSQYGVIAFTVEYWNGSNWINIGAVTNNNKVWNQFNFSPITTEKIRIVVTQAGPGAGVAHLVEVEVWGQSTTIPTPTITPTPTPVLKPDLVVSNFTITPSNLTEGDVLNFSTTVTNQGAGAMSGFLGVKYQIDGGCPAAGCPSHAVSSTTIAPGQSVTLNGASGSWMSTAGAHTISAQVDDTGVIDESDETNNIATLNVNVSPAPTPTPTPAPAVPTIISVTQNADPTCLNITLNGVSGADSYNVKILNSGYTINVTNLSFPWCGLVPATYYEYQAQAGNQYGTSGWSATVGGTTANPPPPATNDFSPMGNFDGIDGNLVVTGWSYDPDDPNNSNEVHVYIGGPAGGGGVGYSATANQPRPDVNNTFGIGGNHGFSFQIPAQFNTGQWTPVYVYGIDRGTNSPTLLQGSPQYFGTEPEPTPTPCNPSQGELSSCARNDGWWDWNDCQCKYWEQKSDQNQQEEKGIWDNVSEIVSGWFK